MQTAALAVRIDTQDAHDDRVTEQQSDLRLLPKAEKHPSLSQGQVVHVCFPVLVPGDDNRIIPFGRYELSASPQNGSPSTTPEEVVLVDLDSGARVALSVQELTAIARDPDIEII